MHLVLTRYRFTTTATLGTLGVVYADRPGEVCPFGFVVEDTDRGLDEGGVKVKGRTAIPAGTYTVRRTWSPKYGAHIPEVLAVPGFRGIRIHSGNDAGDTEGCLLPGLHADEALMTVSQSRDATRWIYAHIEECEARHEPVTVSIVRDPLAWSAWRSR